ncbi:MAG: hypothetical protein R3242_04855 [Akkermansiaceae bacterium]|nr:hypothetical protein [Akkermansiaceae bacterium]
MNDPHAYENLPLFGVGLALGFFLIALHLLMLLKREPVQQALVKFQRDPKVGQILLAVGLAWFWLLCAPSGLGMLSSLAMDFGEFNRAKSILRLLVPAMIILVALSVRDFLAVRALGLIGLMVAAPILEAAFLEDPVSRLLLPIYAYPMLTISMFLVGKPYLFRDGLDWLRDRKTRWQVLSLAGLAYGLAVVICALLFWRGY